MLDDHELGELVSPSSRNSDFDDESRGIHKRQHCQSGLGSLRLNLLAFLFVTSLVFVFARHQRDSNMLVGEGGADPGDEGRIDRSEELNDKLSESAAVRAVLLSCPH